MLYPGAGSLLSPHARANLSSMFPTAMSIVSPKIRYRRSLYAITCVFPPDAYSTTGISRARDQPAHLDVRHAVIHPHERFIEQQRQRPRARRRRRQRRPHPRPSREAHRVHVSHRRVRLLAAPARASSTTTSRWCRAVSRGRNPVPGGVTYVSRGFARIVAAPRVTTPTEILFALPSNPIATRDAPRIASRSVASSRRGVDSFVRSLDARALDDARRDRGRIATRDDARTSSRRRDRGRVARVRDGAIADAIEFSRWRRKVVRDDDARDDDASRRARDGRRRRVRWVGGRGGRGGGRDDDADDEDEDDDDDDETTRRARRAARALAAATAAGAGGARRASASTTTTRRRGDGERRATKLGDMATSALYGFAAFYGIKIALKRLFAPFALFWGTTTLLFRMRAVQISPAMLHERLIRPYLPIEYQKSLNDFGVAAMKTKVAKNAMRDGWWDKQERRFWTCAHRLLPACDSAMGERAFVFGVILAGLA